MSRELPVLSSGEMVRAILDGRKTQTRRPVKPQPFDFYRQPLPASAEIRATDDGFWLYHFSDEDGDGWEKGPVGKCPLGAVGDCLYVRETWALHRETFEGQGSGYTLQFRADSATREVLFDGRVIPAGDPKDTPKPWPATAVNMGWRPSIHCPKWAARIWLEVTDVRVERVQGISTEDVIAEGLSTTLREHAAECDLRDQFVTLWGSVYGKQGFGWELNPWCWCVSFRRIDR